MSVKWWMVLIISVLVFTALIAAVLPRIFLKASSSHAVPCDRGLKKIREPDGESILFESAEAARRYLRQYILSRRGGKKVLVCRLEENVCYLDYDVLIFDRCGKMFQALNVKEIVEKRGYTQQVELPGRTSYVTLAINEVNDKKISEKVISVSRGRKAAFALLVCALTVAEIFLVKACCAHLFGGIYAEIFLDLESSDSFQITLLLSLVAVAINLGAFAAVVRAKRGKKTVGGKK